MNGLPINLSITDEMLALREQQARESPQRAAFDALLAFGEFSDVAGENAKVCAAWIVDLERRVHHAEGALVEHDRASVRRESEHAAAMELARLGTLRAGGNPAAYVAVFEAAREYGHPIETAERLAKLIGFEAHEIGPLVQSIRSIVERLPRVSAAPRKKPPRPPPTRTPGPGRKQRR